MTRPNQGGSNQDPQSGGASEEEEKKFIDQVNAINMVV